MAWMKAECTDFAVSIALIHGTWFAQLENKDTYGNVLVLPQHPRVEKLTAVPGHHLSL